MSKSGECVLALVLCTIYYTASYDCGRCQCKLEVQRGCIAANCSHLGLLDIPTYLPPNTCSLDMQENHVTKITKSHLKNLSHLLLLNLSRNAIFNIEEGSFEVPTTLVTLDLSNNLISFKNRSLDILAPLQNLKVLDLSNNSYVEYPAIFQSLQTLEQLKLDGRPTPLGGTLEGLNDLSYLSLSGFSGRCNISTITLDYFHKVTSLLTFLDISYCNISVIQPGSLSKFQDIKSLDLSGNTCLGFKGFENATCGLDSSKLDTLKINRIVPQCAICVHVMGEHVQHLTNTSLRLLEANDNRIEVFDEHVFGLLPRTLKYASVRGSRFTTWPYLWRLGDLEGIVDLDISGVPGVRKVPFASDVNKSESKVSTGQCDTSAFTAPVPASIDWTIHRSMPMLDESQHIFHLPPHLTNFTYTNAELTYVLSGMHFAPNNLRYIDLSYNMFKEWQGPIFGLENITHLDLSANIAKNISPSFFHAFPSLIFLNVSQNFLEATLYRDAKGVHFAKQKKLEVLDLSMNSIQFLHKKFLIGLKSLRVLNVSRNNIVSWSLYLADNPHLLYLDLSYNNVGFIGIHGQKQMTWLADRHTFSIDLSHNELQCICHALNFFDWLLKSNIHPANLDRYYCRDAHRHVHHYQDLLQVLGRLKVSCPTYIALSMGSLCIVVVTTTLIVCAIVYRYRWKLIYWYQIKIRPPSPRPDNTYEYDVFVSYADSEETFACMEMRSRLEIEHGLKLYLRDREAVVGTPIAHNILNGLQASRKAVICMSKTFLNKKWCNYELHLSYLEGLNRNSQVVIVVFLEHVSNKDIPLEILRDVTNIQVLEYPHREDNLREFYECLVSYIRS